MVHLVLRDALVQYCTVDIAGAACIGMQYRDAVYGLVNAFELKNRSQAYELADALQGDQVAAVVMTVSSTQYRVWINLKGFLDFTVISKSTSSSHDRPQAKNLTSRSYSVATAVSIAVQAEQKASRKQLREDVLCAMMVLQWVEYNRMQPIALNNGTE